MKIEHTFIDGLLVIEPAIFTDSRGHFFESYNDEKLSKFSINTRFVQDNQSRSNFGVVRGLHFQKEPYAQAKLVRVLNGEVLDVAVDLRPDSITYCKYYSIILSSENNKQLFIPRGFAHGFVVLSEQADFFYKCDNYFSKKHEDGVRFDSKQFNIDWIIEDSKLIASDKDFNLRDLL